MPIYVAIWQAASRDADKRLDQARIETERKLSSMVKRALQMAEASHGGMTYMEAFITLQQEEALHHSHDMRDEVSGVLYAT